MPVTSRWLVSALMAVGVSSTVGHALGADAQNDSRAACASAYERSQEHRQSGELLAARADLTICQQPECPEFIRADCAQWSNEVAAAQPTVVFSAKRGTELLVQVRVSSGGKILTERLNGQAIDLDPGTYDFRFESQGSSAIVRHAVISAGDKGQVVQVEFAEPAVQSLDTPPESIPRASVTHQSEAPRSVRARPGALPWTLVAVGAASVGTGVGLAVWGHSGELGLRRSCAPDCYPATVQQIRTRYLFADISFGVGLTSLAAAVYLLAHDRAAPDVASTVPVTVVAGPTGVLAAYGTRF
jgi:hypothetical protein